MEKENSGEDLSSTASHSSASNGGCASEESGWTSYIDYFMETQQQQRRKEEVSRRAGDPFTDDAGAGRRRSSTSECSSDTGVGASTWLPALVEPSTVVSRRLSLSDGWRRKKKVLYDESLEDTATSPISCPKLIELIIKDSDATHHKNKVNSSDDEISRSKRKSTTGGDVNGANTTIDTGIKKDSAYDNNELMMKKGLCLVPVSAFHV